jgi:GrpB-like predicted nucleotidyltransferase (UPF0157 family)
MRDFLRSHPDAALAYARRKRQIWMSGARRLLVYSAEKATEMTALFDAAKRWRAG